MSTTTEQFVDRAVSAFRDQLSALVSEHGAPSHEPEHVGTRAALLSVSDLLWAEHVGPFVDTTAAMALLDGVTKQAVSQRVRGRRLLALRTGSGQLVYPLWQFTDGALLGGLGEVLAVAGYDPDRPSSGWTIASWLSTHDPDLGGRPRDLLAAGRPAAVVEAAADVRSEWGLDELEAAGEVAA